MKKYIVFFMVALFLGCAERPPLEYDDNKVILDDSIRLAPKDKFFYKVEIPTRQVFATIEIVNKSDTARAFKVSVIEK